MGLWVCFFVAEFFLAYRGSISLNVLWNFLLIGCIYAPIPSSRRRLFRITKELVTSAFAAAILWNESWYGAINGTNLHHIDFAMPSLGYCLQLLAGVVFTVDAASLSAIMIVCIVLHRRGIKLASVVFVLLTFVGILHVARGQTEMDRYVNDFYDSESHRVISFPKSEKRAPDFDIVILHVCSLSWDDLRLVGLENADFLKRFDFVFTHFNSVTSYSGPSYIRLFRSNCGQERHGALYQDAPEDCYLMESLRSLGYKTMAGNNFGGPVERFVREFEIFGKADRAMGEDGLKVASYDYDNSAIYGDFDTLMKLWNLRNAAQSQPVALYYNTVSLHDGVHLAGETAWWAKDRQPRYRARVEKLFVDLDKFMETLESSGRNVLFVFVAEHGAALRASRFQTAGIREVPLPQITTVPLAIKFISTKTPHIPVKQYLVDEPVSYLAISYVLDTALEHSPFDENFPSEQIAASVPKTPYVSANEDVSIAAKNGRYFISGKGKGWQPLSMSP